MVKNTSNRKYRPSPTQNRGDSSSRHHDKSKKKTNKGDTDHPGPFPFHPLSVPPSFGQMMPPSTDGPPLPMILPGMPLPAPLLMNMPLPPPDADPEEIKKALKILMSNFPSVPGKDAKFPFPPGFKPPLSKRKRRPDSVQERPQLTLQEQLEADLDRHLKDSEISHPCPIAKFLQIPGLMSKRHLKSSTVDGIESAARRRSLKVKFLDFFDLNKDSDRDRSRSSTPNLDKMYKKYHSLGLGKVECVLPLVNSLE